MADQGNFYQAVGFHFSVHFPLGDGNSVDVKFQSVTGLDSTIDTEPVKEGGENRFEHVIPTRRKFGPLVLKRGLLGPKTSDLSKWMKKIFEEDPFTGAALRSEDNPHVERVVFKVFPNVNIHLLGEDSQVLMRWTINNVWPRSWKIGELNAERGEVLIETMELNYNRLVLEEEIVFNPPK
jgi:phage tail-like protein